MTNKRLNPKNPVNQDRTGLSLRQMILLTIFEDIVQIQMLIMTTKVNNVMMLVTTIVGQ